MDQYDTNFDRSRAKLNKEIKFQQTVEFASSLRQLLEILKEVGYDDVHKWDTNMDQKYFDVALSIGMFFKILYIWIRSGKEPATALGNFHMALQGFREAAKQQQWHIPMINPTHRLNPRKYVNEFWTDYDLDVIENWIRFCHHEKDILLETINSQHIYIKRVKVCWRFYYF